MENYGLRSRSSWKIRMRGPGQWWEVGLALVGIKPVVETWRVLTGAPTPKDHLKSPEVMLALSRITEVLAESLPQAALQGYVYLQTDEPTALQHVSLLGSLAAAGYILAMVDCDMARQKRTQNISQHTFAD